MHFYSGLLTHIETALYLLLIVCLWQLIKVNQPDLVLFVGEALVGNEAVDQLVKFNQALADYSSMENPHLIDGIVLTKYDTIDDKVGANSCFFAAWTLANRLL